MSFFRHLGKKKAKFAFTLLIRTAEQLEATSWKNGQAVHLQAKRGSKSVQTKVALLEEQALRWNEALSFICTMYKKEIKGQKEPEWQAKPFVLSLKTDVKEESKWRVELDMSKFIKDGGQMEVVQTLSLSQKDGPVLKLTVRSHDIEKSQPYDPFDFSNDKDTSNGNGAAGGGNKTIGRGMSKRELKTPATPGAVSEADRKRLLHRRGESMVMGVAAVESPPASPKGGELNLGHSEEPPFVLTRSGSRNKVSTDDDSELTEEQKNEKRWDERIRKATTPRAASGGAAAANGFQHDSPPPAGTVASSSGTSSNGRLRTPTNGNRKGSQRSNRGSDSSDDDTKDDTNDTSGGKKDNDTTAATDASTAAANGHSRKESRRSSKVMFEDLPLGPTPNGGGHERRSSLKPPGSDPRPERRGSRQGTPFPTISTDTPTNNGDAPSGGDDDSDSDDGGLRGRRRMDDAERNRIGGGGGNSTRARDAPSTPAFRPGNHDDDDFFDRQGGGVTAKFEQATDDVDDGEMTPERTLSDGGIERDSGVADLSRYHDNGRGSELVTSPGLPSMTIMSGGAGAPKKPHRRGFSRFQHASAAGGGGERPGSRAKGTSADGSNKKLSIDATSRLALAEEDDESTPKGLGELNPQQLARLTAMHATPISPRASPSTPRGAR